MFVFARRLLERDVNKKKRERKKRKCFHPNATSKYHHSEKIK